MFRYLFILLCGIFLLPVIGSAQEMNSSKS